MNIHPLHTSCKNCVFATYEENRTQTGCALSYLEIYRAQKTEILEVYDANSEFYVINEKKCPGYRENSWFMQYGLENSSVEDKLNKFYEMNKINYLLVINFNLLGASEDTLAILEQILSGLTIHPQKIVFITSGEPREITSYKNLNQLMVKAKINCTWRMQGMVDDTISNEEILHSIVNLNKPYRFICSLQKIPTDLNHLLHTANEIVYKKLEQFNVLTDGSGSCILFSGGVYRFSLAENHIDILSDPSIFQVI